MKVIYPNHLTTREVIRRQNNLMCNVICTKNTGDTVFYFFLHLWENNQRTKYILYREVDWVTVKQAVDARENS